MPGERILILGGTGGARHLASALLRAGYDIVTSLAGVTASPILPEGKLRRGGFGGTDGLARYVAAEGIAAIVDATHPFAAQMSRQAAEAAALTHIPLVRLERAPWVEEPAGSWLHAADAADAARLLPDGAMVFLTLGRKEAGVFFARPGLSGIARMIEEPGGEVPEQWRLVLARPPFRVADESDLMRAHGITHLVAKNAGGEDTRAKLVAARDLGIRIVMIDRPHKPEARADTTPEAVIATLRHLLSP